MEGREERWLAQLRQLAPTAGVALLAGLGVGWGLGWWHEGGQDLPSANANASDVAVELAAVAPPLVAVEAPPEALAVADGLPEMDEPWSMAGLEAAEASAVAEAAPAPDVELDPGAEPGLEMLAAVTPDQPEEPPAVVAAEVALAIEPPPATAPVGVATTPEPRAAARPAPAPAPPAPVAAAPRRAGVVSYVAAPGDTLSGIAARHGVSVETLRQANDFGRSGVLRAGQTLTVPTIDGPVHTVAPGETLSSIAASYRADLKQVASANGLSGNLTVRSGQRLVIPGGSPPPALASRPITPRPTSTPGRPQATR